MQPSTYKDVSWVISELLPRSHGDISGTSSTDDHGQLKSSANYQPPVWVSVRISWWMARGLVFIQEDNFSSFNGLKRLSSYPYLCSVLVALCRNGRGSDKRHLPHEWLEITADTRASNLQWQLGRIQVVRRYHNHWTRVPRCSTDWSHEVSWCR